MPSCPSSVLIARVYEPRLPRAADTAEHRSGVRVECCQLACTPSSDYKVSACNAAPPARARSRRIDILRFEFLPGIAAELAGREALRDVQDDLATSSHAVTTAQERTADRQCGHAHLGAPSLLAPKRGVPVADASKCFPE
jgi:hypothetical protein